MELINKIKNILSPNNFNFIHEESVDSTMISIKNFIGTQNVCMIADEQKSGIGRRGNEWVSPKGNIYIAERKEVPNTPLAKQFSEQCRRRRRL